MRCATGHKTDAPMETLHQLNCFTQRRAGKTYHHTWMGLKHRWKRPTLQTTEWLRDFSQRRRVTETEEMVGQQVKRPGLTYAEICVCVCVTDNIQDLRFSTWNAPQTSGILNCKRSKSEEICSMYKSRRANQSILKEISPEYSLEGLMLKLKLQYFGHLM